MQRRGRRRIDHAELRADVQRDVRRIALGKRNNAEIGRDDRIHPASSSSSRYAGSCTISSSRGNVLHVTCTAAPCACASCTAARMPSGVKIFGSGAHAELRPGQIYCVCTEMERHLQALQISGRA